MYDTNLKNIDDLIGKFDYSIRVFQARYSSGSYVMVGYSNILDKLENTLTGGDVEALECFFSLGDYNNLPIVGISENQGVIEGLNRIEEKIDESIKDMSLKKYLESVSEIMSDCVG